MGECSERLKIHQDIINAFAKEREEIDIFHQKRSVEDAKEKQQELKKKGLNISFDEKDAFQIRDYKEYVKKQLSEYLCNFLSVLIRKDLKDDFFDMISRIRDVEEFRRFLTSTIIYHRMHTKLNEVEDKFIYLCIAVEAAKRFGTGRTTGATDDFVNFFIGNLSNNSIQQALSYFEIMGATKNLEKLKEEKAKHLFRYLYQKRSVFVHEGRLFEPSVKESEFHICIYKPDFRKDDWKAYVRFNMPFKFLCSLYEEALLKEFSSGIEVEEGGF